MLNSDLTKVVLVRNWKGTSWSFPKGKINQSETSFACAVRETYEETGFNPIEYCNEEQFLVVYEEKKVTKLFIAIGIPENYNFITLTRKEISKIEFHFLDRLPEKSWGVHPFLEKLQRWIRRYKERNLQQNENNKGKNNKKRISLSSKFDERNEDTFGINTLSLNSENGTNEIGWTVQDMFATNSRLTGQRYVYDGNPHNFGSTHPQYVNYNSISTPTHNPTSSNSNNNQNNNNNATTPSNMHPSIKVNNHTTSTTTSNNNNNNLSTNINTSISNNHNNYGNQNNNNKNISNNNSETILQNKTMKIFSNMKNEKKNSLYNKNYFNIPFVFNSSLVMQQVDKVLKEYEE